MRRRAQLRRVNRSAAQQCLTITDAARLDATRRLCDDFPSIQKAKRRQQTGEQITDAQLDTLRSEVEEVSWQKAHPILMAVRRSKKFKELQQAAHSHPGPLSRLAPDLLLTALIVAVSEQHNAWRNTVCQVINGMDTRLWHEAGMCNHQTREPVSFSTVRRQLDRLETLASGVPKQPDMNELLRLQPQLLLPRDEPIDDCLSLTEKPHEEHQDTMPGLRRLISDILAATIPKKRLKQATAVAVDQTDFESFYTCAEWLKQDAVDRAIADAFYDGEDPPDGFMLGPDRKLIRCADLHARGGHRSATAKRPKGQFTGYAVTLAVLVRSAHWTGRPNKCRLGPKVPPYIAALSVDPACRNPGVIGARVVSDANDIAPNLQEVLADRGFTQLADTFNRRVHRLGLDVVMDYKEQARHQNSWARAGQPERSHRTHTQRLRLIAGVMLPEWTPREFQGTIPDYRTMGQWLWYEDRARYRWSPVQRLPDGGIQFRCPQCSGRVVTNLTTHRNNAPVSPSAVQLTVPQHGECCEGLAAVAVEFLDEWQRIPWGTLAWKTSYSRRLQVENANSILKRNGALSNRFCRTRDIAAHTFAVLCLAIAHNLNLAKTDPYAADTSNDESTDRNGDGSPAGDADSTGSDESDEDTGDDRLRAPP